MVLPTGLSIIVAFALLWPSSLFTLRKTTTTRCNRMLVSAVESDKSATKTNVVVIKIGGSSITDKAQKETLNPDALKWFAQALAKAISPRFLAPSKECSAESAADYFFETKLDTAFVIIHGAGSFGHHSAKEYGLKGQTQPPPPTSVNSTSLSSILKNETRLIMHGLAQTRRSVQKLNGAVVAALLDHGMNAVGISPCFGIPGMQAHGCLNDAAQTAFVSEVVYSTIQSGLVPVLHGDACLYGANNAGILSGDTLMELLGTAPWVSRAIFITDVDGVFTQDPRSNPDTAELIRSIAVNGTTGELELLKSLDASASSHDHDVTGGLKTKLASAATIAASGTNVTIVRCESNSAERALQTEDGIGKATILYRI